MSYNEVEVSRAFKVIKQAMIDGDPGEQGSFAHSWHCNIACVCADSIHDDRSEALSRNDAHRIGNEAASRFMKLLFGVDTKA